MRTFAALHHDGFGDVQGEHAGFGAASFEDVGDRVDEEGLLELPGGEVDAYREGGPRRVPVVSLLGLAAGLFEDPLSQRHDKTCLLGERDELLGGDEAALVVVPPRQGLDAHDAAGFEVELRLVVEHELPALDGPPEVVLKRNLHAGLATSSSSPSTR